MGGQIDKWMNGQTNGWINSVVHWQMDRQPMDQRMDGWERRKRTQTTSNYTKPVYITAHAGVHYGLVNPPYLVVTTIISSPSELSYILHLVLCTWRVESVSPVLLPPLHGCRSWICWDSPGRAELIHYIPTTESWIYCCVILIKINQHQVKYRIA